MQTREYKPELKLDELPRTGRRITPVLSATLARLLHLYTKQYTCFETESDE